ncbi:MAG: hypothetical protein ABIJ96_02190 [Elusimicrobiota bacterium]
MSRIKRLWAESREYLTEPLFLFVLAVKLAAGSFFAAEYFLRRRSLPFVRRGLGDAFPYSSMMLAGLAKWRGEDKVRVAWSMEPTLEHQVLEIEGGLPADEVKSVAYSIFPDLDEFMPAGPRWRSGVHGMNQLVFLTLYRWAVGR